MIIEIRQQLNSTESHSKNIVLNRVITYILDALSAEDWLYKIRKEITNEQEKCFIFITFRFFGIEEIEKYKIKSYTRYYKKEEYLDIDPIFILDKYKDLNEDKIREELCNDIFIYLEKILLKYEKSFTHFNVRNFISILYDRLQEVKDEKLPYIVYEEEEWLEGIIKEMFDDKFNLIK
ncbi:hypothetical protein [uncultured Capnocytophaga sp.]|jgi:hypothetical protein|uniref:hypothetical protein n=1 Tax=uncultured Capnocytophaga sp. TaxID=159273 RepID=UPI002616FAF1|nr:hypothetical protein [uncultured Capnocytophaga sp.]